MFLFISFAFSFIPKGAPLSTWDQYNANINENDGLFKCFDGKKTITIDKINDDYADCADGSDEPGTSASNNGFFYCKNPGYFPDLIPKWSVGDGNCDCCDGADEEGNKNVQCENKCAELEMSRKEAASELISAFTEGIKKRNAMESSGIKIFKSQMITLESYQKELKSLNESLANLREDLQRSNETAGSIQVNTLFHDSISKIYDFTFGWHRPKVSFASRLQSEIIDHKENRVKELTEKIDELINISQLQEEVKPLLSMKDEELRIDRFTVNLFGQIKDRYNSIGYYKSFDRSNNTLLYDWGDFCFAVDSARKAFVELKCWKSVKLISNSEPRTCEYEFVLGTPLACSQQSIDQLNNMTKADIEELTRKYDR